MAVTTLPVSVQNAVSLLTSRLMLAPLFSEETIELLSRSLCAALAPLASRVHFTITLRLNAAAPPPPALLTACTLSGVKWKDWALALTAGKAVETTMQITPSGVSWIGSGITPIHLRAMTPSALPKLEMTVGINKLSVSRPVSPSSSSASSDTDSLFEKASSSSSASTSPASSRCHSRSTSIESLASVKSMDIYVPPRRMPVAFHRRTQSNPVIDTAAIEVQHFKYQGGETNVLGGGVMLGAGGRKTSALSTKENDKPSPFAAKKGRSRAASRAGNWRRV